MPIKKVKIIRTEYQHSSGNVYITYQNMEDGKEEVLCARALSFLQGLGINAIPKQEMPSDFFSPLHDKIINLDISKDPDIPSVKNLKDLPEAETTKVFSILNEYPDAKNPST